MNRGTFKPVLAFLTFSLLAISPDSRSVSAAETIAPISAIPTNPPAIFMIGDSTMADKPLTPPQPERGWGQLLPLYFLDVVHIRNFALNGRSSKSFRDEYHWKNVLEELHAGDYVIIQFGHNDEKQVDPKRYTDPATTFKKNLEAYVRETRERRAIPILATPIARRSFDSSGALLDTHGTYPESVRQVAAAEKVPLLDLEKSTSALLKKLGPELSKKMFVWCEPGEFAAVPDGRKDDTHLNAVGASRVCDIAAEDLRTAVPALDVWLKRVR